MHGKVVLPHFDEGAYLDSQSIGPGSGHTYEITYNGSGNRNKTPADAIFHCHFYPHFAQGMWAMWRNHDTFEWGTLLDADGRPAAGELWQTRALPDGEIAAGVPSVGLVPLPGKPMAPAPTEAFPGFPYYIPGVAGHRPPQPPLDFAKEALRDLLAHPFTLEMSYSSDAFDTLAAQGRLYLAWLDGSAWENAVLGNHTGTPATSPVLQDWTTYAGGAGIGDANLGSYVGIWGVDTANNTVWAVLDHNSQFAVWATPEPSTLLLLACGGWLLLRVGRRRE